MEKRRNPLHLFELTYYFLFVAYDRFTELAAIDTTVVVTEIGYHRTDSSGDRDSIAAPQKAGIFGTKGRLLQLWLVCLRDSLLPYRAGCINGDGDFFAWELPI